MVTVLVLVFKRGSESGDQFRSLAVSTPIITYPACFGERHGDFQSSGGSLFPETTGGLTFPEKTLNIPAGTLFLVRSVSRGYHSNRR